LIDINHPRITYLVVYRRTCHTASSSQPVVIEPKHRADGAVDFVYVIFTKKYTCELNVSRTIDQGSKLEVSTYVH
jgi:hypothetical protein